MKKTILLFALFVAFAATSFAQTGSGHQENGPAPVFVKSEVNANRASGCNFLVFMDNLPWGSSSIQDYLTANGETFSVLNSSAMASTDFSAYDVIIVASDQVPGFYANFSANFVKFETFVTNGGSLEVHSATCGWNSPCGYSVVLPGGVYTTEQYDATNNIVNPANPIVAGIPNPFSGTWASHGYFSNLVAGTDIITETSSNNKPTTIQYHYAGGVVTATTCTYEYGCGAGEQACNMLHNNLNYSCSHAIEAQVPVADWAVGIGIFLIAMAAFLRYRRLV
jgi:hypothetical protein